MTIVNPLVLFAQTANMLTQSSCPQCGKKDASSQSPGRVVENKLPCDWCMDRNTVLTQSRQWLQRESG